LKVGVFSTSLPPEVIEFSKTFMHQPVRILVEEDEHILDKFKQFYVNVGEEYLKVDVLCDLFETLAITQSVIYADTNRKVCACSHIRNFA
jgi:translation initiation factor 4A